MTLLARQTPKVARKNLVIAVVGDNSHHKSWFNSKRNYDICLIYYGKEKDKYKDDATYYFQQEGYKWQLIYQFIEQLPKYEYIWCPDDDIDINNINELFEITKNYHLNLAQPSLTIGSSYKHKITLNKNDFIRYTNIVDLMCPIFSNYAFELLKPTFNENCSGNGHEFIWSKLLGYKNCGIIDKIQVSHFRPMRTGELHIKYKEDNIDLVKEKNEALERYGNPFCSLVEFGSIKEEIKPKKKVKKLPKRNVRGNCSENCAGISERLLKKIVF